MLPGLDLCDTDPAKHAHVGGLGLDCLNRDASDGCKVVTDDAPNNVKLF